MSIHEPTLQFLHGRLFEEVAANYGGVMISIGHKLGLFKAMAGAGPLTSRQVADRAGCAERYVREWLNAQVAGGCIDYDADRASYLLTAEQAAVLADETSPFFLGNSWQVVASLWADEEKTLAAFRSGEGVPWSEHDGRLFCGSAAFYRNSYQVSLLQDWLPSLDGVVAGLEAGARVLDVGCGHGHSTVIMAEAFPRSRFFGIDGHAGSIEVATRLAAEHKLDGRVRFAVGDARELDEDAFDLVCFFDCLHDMGHPVKAAKAARRALRPGGVAMLIEPFATDRVENNIGPVGRIYYSASSALCCAHAISEKGTHVLGAQAGFGALAKVLREAGFSGVRLAAQSPYNLVIEARA